MVRIDAALRTAASAVLLVLACVAVPAAITATWLRTTVSDTDSYVATVGPLADEPAVQERVADRLTEELMSAVDREGLVQDGLAALLEDRDVPPRAVEVLALALAPVRDALEERVHRLAEEVLAGDAFAQAWRDAHRSAHAGLLDVMETGVSDGTAVPLDLATVANTLRQTLVERDVPFADQLPEVEASFALADGERLASVGAAYDTLDAWAGRLVVLALVLPAVGVALARRRGRALTAWLAGCVVACVVVLVALALGRDLLIDRLGADATLAGPVVEVLTSRLRTLLVGASGLFAIALVARLAVRLTRPDPLPRRWGVPTTRHRVAGGAG